MCEIGEAIIMASVDPAQLRRLGWTTFPSRVRLMGYEHTNSYLYSAHDFSVFNGYSGRRRRIQYRSNMAGRFHLRPEEHRLP
jgi:hypothetical protein